MYQLDQKDRKLLELLDSNFRIQNVQIARELHISKQTVDYRIKKLEREGIISGYYPVINFARLGYFYVRSFFSFHNMSEKMRQKFIEFVQKKKEFFWVFRVSGEYEIAFATLVKQLDDYKKIMEEVYEYFGEFISAHEETIMTQLLYLGFPFSQEGCKVHIAKQTSPRGDSYDLDALDKRIIQQLCRKDRSSLTDIAREIGVSYKLVAYRLKRMEREKIILAYRTIINFRKLGLEYYKLFINISSYHKEQHKKFKEFLMSHKSVIYLVEGIGLGEKIDVEVIVSSNGELLQFVDELRKQFPNLVNGYEAITMRENIKTDYFPEEYLLEE